MNQKNSEVLLDNGAMRVGLLPFMGGGIARFDLQTSDGWLPIMRPSKEVSLPTDLASFPMLPWANRMGGAKFTFAHRTYSIARNMVNDFPLHGDGWQSAWSVIRREATRVILRLDSQAVPPFHYRAEQDIRLTQEGLQIVLRITHLGDEPLPYGVGLHPYFLLQPPNFERATLMASADHVWLEGSDFLPHTEIATIGAWSFDPAVTLPHQYYNNCFTQWDGHAEIRWHGPRACLGLVIAAEAENFVLYAPERENYFCFEPQDHLINGINFPGGPEKNGMTVLAKNELLAREYEFFPYYRKL